jgi:DNA-binding SARP family transcriptional activator
MQRAIERRRNRKGSDVPTQTVAAARLRARTRRGTAALSGGPDTRIALLRGFELTVGGGRVELPGSAQRVLAFLALAERPLHRVYVAGKLWLDSSQEHANASLRTALWRVKQTGVPLVGASSTLLQLDPAVVVDVRALLEASQRALAESADDGFLQFAAVGELLPDWYDDWVIVERERFRVLQLHALEALCVSLTAERRFAEAVAAGMAAVTSEPLRESAHRALIEAFLAEGNAADAIRQYRLFRDLIRRELGLEPSPLLRQLVELLPTA